MEWSLERSVSLITYCGEPGCGRGKRAFSGTSRRLVAGVMRVHLCFPVMESAGPRCFLYRRNSGGFRDQICYGLVMVAIVIPGFPFLAYKVHERSDMMGLKRAIGDSAGMECVSLLPPHRMHVKSHCDLPRRRRIQLPPLTIVFDEHTLCEYV